MTYAFDTKRELRDYLQGKHIGRVDFGAPGTLADERQITLHLGGGEGLRIEATPYGTLKIEAI
jgi:hypothetical protein